jgi:hypothetical protein
MPRQGGNFMKGSNRSQMGSNAVTAQNQGGGSRKAGFPYMIGRDHNSSIFIQNQTLLKWNTLPFGYRVRPSRPVGMDHRIPMR